MSNEDRKTIVRRFVDAWNKNTTDAFDDFLSPDLQFHDPVYGEKDRDGFKQFSASVHTSYPDIRITDVDLFAAEGDRVVERFTLRGTDLGGSIALGTPPTGKRISIQAVLIYRFSGDRIVEVWQVSDLLSLSKQLQGS